MTAMSSQGVILKMGTTVIGEITSFKGPGGSATVIDATTLASVAKEKVMGLPDEGSFTFDLNYDSNSTGHKAFIDARVARTVQTFSLTLANADIVSFSGYALGFEITGAVDALVTGTGTIEVTGAVTWPIVP